jgi:hypothetical protein
LFSIFGKYSNEFEYSERGVFRRVKPLSCSDCGSKMVHNGYNSYTRKELGSVRIGRYICPICRRTCEEKRGFWEDMKNDFFSFLNRIFQVLRVNHVSYRGISDLMDLVYPVGKDTILNSFTRSVEQAIVPPVEDFSMVHYDEKHPKHGRTQKYRLTLMDHLTGRPIADELYDTKAPETVKKFLKKHLKCNKPIFMVTNLYQSYAPVMEEVFGENPIHQILSPAPEQTRCE